MSLAWCFITNVRVSYKTQIIHQFFILLFGRNPLNLRYWIDDVASKFSLEFELNKQGTNDINTLSIFQFFSFIVAKIVFWDTLMLKDFLVKYLLHLEFEVSSKIRSNQTALFLFSHTYFTSNSSILKSFFSSNDMYFFCSFSYSSLTPVT